MTSLLRLPRVDGLRASGTEGIYKICAESFGGADHCTASWRRHRPSSVPRRQRARSSPRSRPGQM